MSETFVVHDVGAANFIPSHLLLEDIIFYHFEPDPRGLKGLQRFYEETGFCPAGRFLRQHALGAKKSQLKLNLADKNTGSSFKDIGQSAEQVSVDVEAAEELILDGRIEAPNLIKIDVEGFEKEVLMGYDLSRPEICCIEVEVTLSQSELGNIINLATAANFELTKLIQHGAQRNVQPTKMQKRWQRWLKNSGLLLATDGSALSGMASLSSSLIQLELVFTRFNDDLPYVGEKIKAIYGICNRDEGGRLHAGGRRVGLLSSWRFWR